MPSRLHESAADSPERLLRDWESAGRDPVLLEQRSDSNGGTVLHRLLEVAQETDLAERAKVAAVLLAASPALAECRTYDGSTALHLLFRINFDAHDQEKLKRVVDAFAIADGLCLRRQNLAGQKPFEALPTGLLRDVLEQRAR